MTDKERKAFDLGLRHGVERAIDIAFGHKAFGHMVFDTPAEEEAYNRGYDRGYNSID